ncbi:MAG: hypothetical protein ACOYVD_06035 [Bacillota bacterium]
MLHILIIAIIILFIYFAVRSKIYLNRMYRKELPEAVDSPLSQALTQLLGIAGGIYLSLVMLSSFLGLEMPNKTSFLDITLDPLALFSLIITILQPIILRLWRNIYF